MARSSSADGLVTIPGSWVSKALGYFGVGLATLVLGLWVRDATNVPGSVAAGAALVGLLAWSSMLRPALWIEPDDRGGLLVIRGLVTTTRIPLAAIEKVAVGQVTAVRVGDKRFTSAVVGRSRRQRVRGSRPQRAGSELTVELSDHVEELLKQRRNDALAVCGIRNLSAEQEAIAAEVVTDYSWPVIAAHALVALCVVGTLLL